MKLILEDERSNSWTLTIITNQEIKLVSNQQVLDIQDIAAAP